MAAKAASKRLEELVKDRFEVCLCNAHHVKNRPGRNGRIAWMVTRNQ